MATDLIDIEGQARLERVPTGIPGLDTILNGGFLRGGIYIVEGSPGTGKTIFANQFCFNHAAAGHRAIYITLLSETYYRMMQHMQMMGFFEPVRIPDALYYANAFRTLEEDGLKGLIDLLRQEIRAHGATLLVLDGFGEVAESAGSAREFKKFINDVQAHVVAEDCTALLLKNERREEYNPEHAMVDGIIKLHQSLFGRHAERELEVLKLRGTDALRGRHSFQITDSGIVVYPRIEAAAGPPYGQ